MFKDQLYRIEGIERKESEAYFRISLDPEDPVFQGHFPGQPVLPGACMTEIVRELLGEAFHSSFDLIRAKRIKMPAMVDPRESPELTVVMEYGDDGEGVRVSVVVKDKGGSDHFKFSGTFREAS